MATRPWITPQDVKDYTTFKAVAERSDTALAVDISRAEQYVISYCNNSFATGELPETVRTATILVAEYYAYNATEGEQVKKSESFDDYSYTLTDAKKPTLEAIGLDTLLDEFKQSKRGKLKFRLTKL